MTYSPFNPFYFSINPNFPFLPAESFISSISNSNPAIVVTTSPHGYQTGYNVRIFFPSVNTNQFGMYQIQGQKSPISVLSPTSFSIAIDTTHYDIFSLGLGTEKPQAILVSQYPNENLLNFQQVNPPNPQNLSRVVVFQKPGLQAPGPCSPS